MIYETQYTVLINILRIDVTASRLHVFQIGLLTCLYSVVILWLYKAWFAVVFKDELSEVTIYLFKLISE